MSADRAAHAERLSALDAAFLTVEGPTSHMHVGALAVFEGGPLVDAHGAVDFARLRGFLAATIAARPRYRQRLTRIPVLGHPAWIDDEHFHLEFHLRHTRLPHPGDDRQLKRLAGRIFSQRLDRDHPLWEMWLIEGLTRGRFALVIKIHHCMIDGIAGADLLASLLRLSPEEQPPAGEVPPPRPSPTRAGLLAAEVRHRAHHLRAAARSARAAMAAPRQAASALGESVAGIARLARRGLTPASSTPLNPRHIGAFRRFDTARFDLAALKAARTRLGGGTVNDVALAAVSGALRRTLLRRGVDVDRLRDIRALVPVNVRPAASRGALGNFVALVFANLPVDVADPRARYARVRENTAKLKTASREVESSALLERIADATATVAVSWSFYLAAYLRAFNFVVTNVPGPPMPLYLAGARLLEVYPLVPLFRSQTLGVALMSYAGSLFVGINADWHAMPDLHDFARDLEESVAELCALGDGTDVTTTSSPSAHCPPPT